MSQERSKQRPVSGQASLGNSVNATFADDSPGTRFLDRLESIGCCRADERRGKLREVEHDLREAEQIASLLSIPPFSTCTRFHYTSVFSSEEHLLFLMHKSFSDEDSSVRSPSCR